MKTTIRKDSGLAILNEVEIPEGYEAFLTEDELALLKYSMAKLDIKELAMLYGQRDKTLKTELVWRLISLGKKLSYIILFNEQVFINWAKANQTNSTYLQGFLDCKNQLKGVVENGLRKKSRRTPKQRRNHREKRSRS